MKKYLNLLLEFHKNRIQLISQSSSKCKNVKMIKLFLQSNGILSLNCGGGSPECDDQFSIQLPKYQHYDIYSNLLKNIIDGKITILMI